MVFVRLTQLFPFPEPLHLKFYRKSPAPLIWAKAPNRWSSSDCQILRFIPSTARLIR
jgi:hypothetical protein